MWFRSLSLGKEQSLFKVLQKSEVRSVVEEQVKPWVSLLASLYKTFNGVVSMNRNHRSLV